MTGHDPRPEFEVPISAGHILQFARAVGDLRPIHVDRRAARAAGFDDVVAPPTFLVVADHFDPEFQRRPRPGEPWLGSGARPSGVSVDELPTAPLHVGQTFDYGRPVVAGETLVARRLAPARWTRRGRRGGALEFEELVTEVRDRDGDLVVRMAWLDVHTERDHRTLSTAPRTDAPPAADVDAAVTLVEDLTRTQLVMYAGAAGDFHPLHHDDVHARHRGYPGVFAPGMLTMAMSVRPLVDAVGGIAALRRVTGRWAAQVWPGDSLSATVAPGRGDREEPGAHAEVTTRDQHGTIVFTGTAAGA